MDTKQKIIIALTILIISLIGFMISDDIDICKTEQVRNESYALGFNQGVEYWNTQVIYSVNNNEVIPYWVNRSYFELPVNQICEEKND